MDINAILSGVTLGAITFGGLLRALFIIAVGAVVIRIVLQIVDRMLEKSKSLSDLREESLPCDIYVLISTQEEVGLRGATVGTYAIDPDWAIAVDVTHAATPDALKADTFPAGKGCTIGIGPNASRALTQALVDTAKAKEIPYAMEVMPRSSGTDGWAIQVARQGVATAILSVPVKYMHSPMELARLSDAEAAANLITEFIRGGWLAC